MPRHCAEPVRLNDRTYEGDFACAPNSRSAFRRPTWNEPTKRVAIGSARRPYHCRALAVLALRGAYFGQSVRLSFRLPAGVFLTGACQTREHKACVSPNLGVGDGSICSDGLKRFTIRTIVDAKGKEKRCGSTERQRTGLFEEVLKRYTEDSAESPKQRGADSVCSPFVFLNLLIADIDLLAQLLLTYAKFQPTRAKPRTNVQIGWNVTFAGS